MYTFLSSDRAPWGVLDNWLNQGHPLGVFTVRADHATEAGWLAAVKGNHQGVWGLAVVDLVTGEPADRLHEALEQSKLRQQKRVQESTQPIQIRPLADLAPRKVVVAKQDRGMGAPRDFTDDQHSQMRPVSRYAQDRHGQGRWVCLHRFGGTIGTLWTDDAQSLGFIPEPGASVALLANSIRSACALGTPTSWVFDDHAAWSTQDHWAGPVQRGDLSTLGLNAPDADSRPIPL